MQKSRFREEQIIGILQEVEAGATIREVCRRHGIAETTYYRWRTKYGGMDVNEARRLKQVEEENRRLKRIVAEQALNLPDSEGLVGKRIVTARERRQGRRTGASRARGFRTQSDPVHGLSALDDAISQYSRSPGAFTSSHRGVSAGAAALGLPDDPRDASTRRPVGKPEASSTTLQGRRARCAGKK